MVRTGQSEYSKRQTTEGAAVGDVFSTKKDGGFFFLHADPAAYATRSKPLGTVPREKDPLAPA